MMRRLSVILLIACLARPAMAADTWDEVKSYTIEKKNEAMSVGKRLVRNTDREIRSLERKASQSSDEVKANVQSDVKELKKKRAEASKKLDAMGKATGAAWDEAKNGFADAYKDLQESYDRAVKKLK